MTLKLRFDVALSSVNMTIRTRKIDKISLFWWLRYWSWRHNAGARELSANHALRFIIIAGARDLSANHTLRCICCLAMKAIWRSTPVVSWGFISKQNLWKIHMKQGHPLKIARCACFLASGGTILLLSVYMNHGGIKIDSVGTNR